MVFTAAYYRSVIEMASWAYAGGGGGRCVRGGVGEQFGAVVGRVRGRGHVSTAVR
ncbi:hypothetical protein ACH4LW_11360 [Streptomyces anulatus]